MADPCDVYVARKLAERGLAWEKSLPQEVWILTLCRERDVFIEFEEARQRWDAMDKHGRGRCDFGVMEKWCTRQHSILRGLNEIPVASFARMMFFDRIMYSRDHPEYVDPRKLATQEALQKLPPLELSSSINPNPGIVYVIQAQDPPLHIKIGRGFSANSRLDQLQTGNPYELRVLREIRTQDAPALEQALKRRYARYNVRGEWFNLGDGTLEEVLMRDFA